MNWSEMLVLNLTWLGSLFTSLNKYFYLIYLYSIMDGKNSDKGTVIQKRSSVRHVFYSYLNFLYRGGRYALNICKWTIYNFGMHGVILLGKNLFYIIL